MTNLFSSNSLKIFSLCHYTHTILISKAININAYVYVYVYVFNGISCDDISSNGPIYETIIIANAAKCKFISSFIVAAVITTLGFNIGIGVELMYLPLNS